MSEIVKFKPTAVDTPTREMPKNLDAEQSLIGLLLMNNNYYGQVSEILTPEHFFDPLHQRIYTAISKALRTRASGFANRSKNPI